MGKRNKRSKAQRQADRQVTQQKQQAKSNRKAKWERKGLVSQLRREQHAANVYGLLTGRGFQCSHVGDDGQRCQAAAGVGSYYCKRHMRQ
jgi:hypothetical protein